MARVTRSSGLAPTGAGPTEPRSKAPAEKAGPAKVNLKDIRDRVFILSAAMDGDKVAVRLEKEPVPLDHVPADVMSAALAAATLIGTGLYGVDLKETPPGPVVIEVNDNPNIDVGLEDACLGDALYEQLLGHFLERIEAGEERAALPARAAGSIW